MENFYLQNNYLRTTRANFYSSKLWIQFLINLVLIKSAEKSNVSINTSITDKLIQFLLLQPFVLHKDIKHANK